MQSKCTLLKTIVRVHAKCYGFIMRVMQKMQTLTRSSHNTQILQSKIKETKLPVYLYVVFVIVNNECIT